MSHIYAWLMADVEKDGGTETFYVDTTNGELSLEIYRNYAEPIISLSPDDENLRDYIIEALDDYLDPDGEWTQDGSIFKAHRLDFFRGEPIVFYVKFVEKYYSLASDTQRLSPWQERPYVPAIFNTEELMAPEVEPDIFQQTQ